MRLLQKLPLTLRGADFAIRFRESTIASACGGRSRPSAEDSAEALAALGALAESAESLVGTVAVTD